MNESATGGVILRIRPAGDWWFGMVLSPLKIWQPQTCRKIIIWPKAYPDVTWGMFIGITQSKGE